MQKLKTMGRFPQQFDVLLTHGLRADNQVSDRSTEVYGQDLQAIHILQSKVSSQLKFHTQNTIC